MLAMYSKSRLAHALSGRSRARRRARGLSLVVIVTIVTAGALDLVAPKPAAAFAVTSHGSPGRVGVPPATLEYGDALGVTEQLTAPARYIYESVPYAGRDQRVCITHRAWEPAGNTWILQDAQQRCYWIRAAATSVVDGAYRSNYRPMMMDWVAYDIVVSWSLANGVPIGDKSVRYEVGNGYDMDLRCRSNLTCWADADNDVIALPFSDNGLNG